MLTAMLAVENIARRHRARRLVGQRRGGVPRTEPRQGRQRRGAPAGMPRSCPPAAGVTRQGPVWPLWTGSRAMSLASPKTTRGPSMPQPQPRAGSPVSLSFPAHRVVTALAAVSLAVGLAGCPRRTAPGRPPSTATAATSGPTSATATPRTAATRRCPTADAWSTASTRNGTGCAPAGSRRRRAGRRRGSSRRATCRRPRPAAPARAPARRRHPAHRVRRHDRTQYGRIFHRHDGRIVDRHYHRSTGGWYRQ